MLPVDSVLLDAGRDAGADSWVGAVDRGHEALLFAAPREVLQARAYAEVVGLLEALDRHAAAGHWCAGYLAYEAGYALDPDGFPDPPRPRGPLAWFGVYDAPLRLSAQVVAAKLRQRPYRLESSGLALGREAYERRVAAIRRHIVEGDVYQINLTAPIHFRLAGDPLWMYADLRRKQRVDYGGVARAGDRWLLSLSPELFVRRDGAHLTTRPMKGTIRRGATCAEDRDRAAWLTTDPKNQAENLMVVDLLRNDLARVARPGSVEVQALFEAERYETLWQMTSTVVAEARPGVGVADVLQALFPCGSVTGAPKRRAMQLIRGLEDEPRGAYCGALGLVKPGGDFVFNVAIRTLELLGDEGRMGVGSGIVWESDARAEYEECLLKARFLTDPPLPDFQLLETMRAEDGTIALIDYHLERLRRSADYFSFPLDEAAIRERLRDIEEGPLRVRLMLSRKGEITVDTTTIQGEDLRPLKAAIYPEPAPLGDPFLRHKTTHRPFYERALRWAHEHGAEEAILLNEQGEVTEGTFTNVWIRRAGRLLTPPEEAGGLAGVYRAYLLKCRTDTAEARLSVQDLLSADAVLLSNAVRGLQEVRLVRKEVRG